MKKPFEYFSEMEFIPNLEYFTDEIIADCTHQGSCDAEVDYWVTKLSFECHYETARKYLLNCGIDEDSDNLNDFESVMRCLFWIACGTAKDMKESE